MNAVAAGRYHRLNGYRHAGNEPGVCPFALYAVVRDLGCLMHVASDAVADIVAHNAEAVRLGILLDRRADIVDAVSCSCEFQSLIKALTCDLNEFFCLLGDLSARVGSCAVAHKSAEGRADVYGNNVTVVDHTLSGDAVDDFLVN